MKAKLYVFEKQMEIKLSDDSVHTIKKNEAKEAFIARVKKIVNDEHLDDEFILVEIDEATVALNDVPTLKAALEGATGLQKKLIEAALAKSTPKTPKESKVKVEKADLETVKASDAYKAAEANIGKYATFSPFKSLEVFEGKVAGIALNKTNTILYYTIVEPTGKRRCCGVLNESVKFIDAPVEVVKAKLVKATKATTKKVNNAEIVDATDAEGTDLAGTNVGDELM